MGVDRGEEVKGGAGDIIVLFTYLSVQVLMSFLCVGRTSSSFCLLTHLAHLDKREPTTHLLTERTLILALTLLVNVEQNNVPDVCEMPILQCVRRIRANKVCRCVSLCDVSVFGVSISVSFFLQSLGVSIYLCFLCVFSSVIRISVFLQSFGVSKTVFCCLYVGIYLCFVACMCLVLVDWAPRTN